MLFFVRFLFIQSYHFVLNVFVIATKIISKFAIVDLQILAIVLLLNIIYKIIIAQILLVKKKILKI